MKGLPRPSKTRHAWPRHPFNSRRVKKIATRQYSTVILDLAVALETFALAHVQAADSVEMVKRALEMSRLQPSLQPQIDAETPVL